MKPVDAIEFALRLNEKPMKAGEILGLVKDIVNEDGVDEHHLSATAKAAPQRFIVSGDTITLQPARAENRVEFFRQRLQGIRDALSLTAFVRTRFLGLELALIYAFASRKSDVMPFVADEGGGLWPMLDELAKEFPPLEQELTRGLKEAWFLVRARVQTELLLMASVRLSPLEYVQEMRYLVSEDRDGGQFCLPWSVGELMARLLGDRADEVYDPAADSSVLPILFSLHKGIAAGATFLNQFAQFFTTLQARILGMSFSSRLGQPNGADEGKLYAQCICAPPFGGKVINVNGTGSRPTYMVAIEQAIHRLRSDGRSVVLVPEGMVFGHSGRTLRKQLVGEGFLSKVVSLPQGVFLPYAGIKTSILVIDKASKSEELEFIDASPYASLGMKRAMTLDVDRLIGHLVSDDAALPKVRVDRSIVLQDEQVDLSVLRWLGMAGKVGQGSAATGVIMPLSDLVTSTQARTSERDDLPFFQVSELASGSIDLVRTAEHGRIYRPASARGARILDTPALLVARIGGVLKPTLFDPSRGPIALGSNVLAFRVNEELVDPRYLALELRSGGVQEQLDGFVKGSAVPSVPKSDLLRLLIRVPERSEQLRIVEEQLDLGLFMERVKKSGEPLGNDMEHFSRLIIKNAGSLGPTGLSKVLNDWMSHEAALAVEASAKITDDNMGLIRHQLNNRLGWLTGGIGNVRRFILGLIDSGVIAQDMAIAPSLEGEERRVPRVTDTLEQLKANATQLSQLLDALTRAVKNKGPEMRELELSEFFAEQVAPLYKGDDRFNLHIQRDLGVTTTVSSDPFLLQQVVTNIIDNAVKHGFVDPQRRYNLYVGIGERMMIIANDGIAPTISLEEMIIRGRSVGVNAGTGIGMHMVNALMTSMRGRLGQHMNPHDHFRMNGSFPHAAEITFGITLRFP